MSNTANNTVYFSLSSYLKDCSLDLDEKLEFAYPLDNKITILLRGLTEIERKNKKVGGYSVCKAIISCRISEKNDDILKKIENNEYASNSNLGMSHTRYKNNGIEYVIPDIDTFASHFQDFTQNIRKNLSSAILNTVNNFRWIYNLEGPPFKMIPTGFYFSRNLDLWHTVPHGIRIGNVIIKSSFKMDSIKNDLLQNSLKENNLEPEYHTLIREAFQLVGQNSRTAIIISVVALEIAVKDCIQSLVQKTQWLTYNIPSPPIVKIISDYIPSITEDRIYMNSRVVISKAMLDKVKNLINLRNDIVHKGQSIASKTNVVEYLELIKDILRIIDFYKGNDWALSYLSKERLEEIT